jgi:hypothetical protein
MKKFLLIILGLIIIIATLTACKDDNIFSKPKLDTPSNIRFEGVTLIWDEVENADKYIVSVHFNKSSYTVSTEETTFEVSINEPGDYSVSVKARNNEGDFKDSEPAGPAVYHLGTGSEDDPIIIYSGYELSNIKMGAKVIREDGKDVTVPLYYVLNQDINLNGEEFKPIGTIANRFQGHFDGRGYTISNYKITVPDGGEHGFFKGVLNGSIRNLNLKDYTIDIKVNGRYNIGGLAGKVTDSNIFNCTVSGSINLKTTDSNTQYVGQLIGYLERYKSEEINRIHGCSAEGSITVQSNSAYVGGLIGYNKDCEIVMCSSKGTVSAKNTNSVSGGGFIGYASGTRAVMRNCYTLTEVSIDCTNNINIGAFIAYAYNCKIYNSYAAGKVENINQSSLKKGFLGLVSGTTVVVFQDNYYDYEAAGLEQNQDSGTTPSNRDGITSLITELMKQQSSYNEWDFEKVWSISEDANGGYPELRAYTEGMFDEEEQ